MKKASHLEKDAGPFFLRKGFEASADQIYRPPINTIFTP